MRNLETAKVALSEAEAALERQLDKASVSDEYRLTAELRIAEVAARIAQVDVLVEISQKLESIRTLMGVMES